MHATMNAIIMHSVQDSLSLLLPYIIILLTQAYTACDSAQPADRVNTQEYIAVHRMTNSGSKGVIEHQTSAPGLYIHSASVCMRLLN